MEAVDPLYVFILSFGEMDCKVGGRKFMDGGIGYVELEVDRVCGVDWGRQYMSLM